jgi:hypothetical protein
MTTFYIVFYESYLSTGSKQALFRSYSREWSVSPECKMVTEIQKLIKMDLSSGKLQFWEWKSPLLVPEHFVPRPCRKTFSENISGMDERKIPTWARDKMFPSPDRSVRRHSVRGGGILRKGLLQCTECKGAGYLVAM